MNISPNFINNYKFNEGSILNQQDDNINTNSFTTGTYPINKLIYNNKGGNQLKLLENYGIPAGLVLSRSKIINEQHGGRKSQSEKMDTDSIPMALTDKIHDTLFALISVNPNGRSSNTKTKKQKK
jgi:hypothetical protein